MFREWFGVGSDLGVVPNWFGSGSGVNQIEDAPDYPIVSNCWVLNVGCHSCVMQVFCVICVISRIGSMYSVLYGVEKFACLCAAFVLRAGPITRLLRWTPRLAVIRLALFHMREQH